MGADRLNPKQFDLYHDYTPAEGPDDHALSTYKLTRPQSDFSSYRDVHMKLSVNHHGTGPVDIQAWNEAHEDYPLESRDTGQRELFRETYASAHPGKSVVELMESTKEARSMALPLLAAAQRDALELHGRGLTPSTGRSKYSEALVQNLAGQGLIEGNQRDSTNGMSFMRGPDERHPATLGDREDPSVLQRAKRDVRDMIRQAPGRKRRTDGTQEPLF